MLVGYAYFFVQFMQFPVLDFGLDHYVSEPFKFMKRYFRLQPLRPSGYYHGEGECYFRR